MHTFSEPVPFRCAQPLFEGKDPGFWNGSFHLFHEMRVAGEEQHLMRGAKATHCFEAGSTSFGIEIHEDIIKNNRQRVDVVRVFPDEGETHRKVELLCCSAAEELRREPDAIRTFDLDVSSVERGDNACVTALRHDGEKRRRLT